MCSRFPASPFNLMDNIARKLLHGSSTLCARLALFRREILSEAGAAYGQPTIIEHVAPPSTVVGDT